MDQSEIKPADDRMRGIIVIGTIVIAVLLVVSTIWMGQSAKKDTENAVHSVSILYLDELAGRREKVVENNLQNRIRDLNTAVGLMDAEDLDSMEHLRAYQSWMKKLYSLEKFAFVDDQGNIYTSLGMQDNIKDYSFDYKTISEPEISVFNLHSPDKKVVIASPVDIPFLGAHLRVCFMEIDMEEMLSGVSMDSSENGATFCNIYTTGGVALSNTILGGLAVEDNLLDAMKMAECEAPYNYERFLNEFSSGIQGEVTFTYNGIRETLSYVPVKNTDWLLSYLVRESVISENISPITDAMINRSLLQSLLTLGAMLVMFLFVISQNRRNNQLYIERETAQAETRGKQEELDERIRLQKQLEQQSQALSDALNAAEESNKAKTVFLSNMSHEIRTPMNAIIGLDNIAMHDPETTPKIRGYLEKINDSAEHLLGLINDILDMSRIESGRMILKNEEFSFSRLIESINTMISAQCEEKGLNYDCRIEGEVDDYYIGDRVKLRQVLINILGNAVKFTPEGGSVEMIVRRLGQFGRETAMEFRIRDTGIGISESFLEHIFEPFSQEENGTTGKYGSSGLGLAITKNIVTMMNGDIQVESQRGKGSVFTVSVTLKDSLRRDGEEAMKEINPEEMSVLVIDDELIACQHAQLVLEKAGISAETAQSGRQALEMVKLRHARREPYNLILVDWQMPEMDGVETSRAIRKAVGEESAIIILTAYRWDDVVEDALKAGVDSFIAKPLFANALLEEFRSAVRTREEQKNKTMHKADLRGKRILLAEDVEINVEIMLMILEGREMIPEVAENGRIAVEKFAASSEGYYDAVLMDMRMPEMDGLEATRRIRAMDRSDSKTIPIIALTANAFDEDVQKSLQAGLNAHLSKPVQPDSLFETLESLIQEDRK